MLLLLLLLHDIPVRRICKVAVILVALTISLPECYYYNAIISVTVNFS